MQQPANFTLPPYLKGPSPVTPDVPDTSDAAYTPNTATYTPPPSTPFGELLYRVDFSDGAVFPPIDGDGYTSLPTFFSVSINGSQPQPLLFPPQPTIFNPAETNVKVYIPYGSTVDFLIYKLISFFHFFVFEAF